VRLIVGLIAGLLLAGCATTAPDGRTIPRGSPSKFNQNPALYDKKVVYITGYLRTGGHWWNFSIGDTDRFRSGKTCLNVAESETLAAFREEFDHMQVTLKGVYHLGSWETVFDGCENGHGMVLDEAFLKKRYGYLLRP